MMWYVLALVIGICVALQPVTNAAGGERIGFGPLMVIANAVVFLFSIVFYFLWPGEAHWGKVTSLRPDYLFGALYGTTIVFGGFLVFPKIGATSALSLIILGQLAFGLIIDHFGLYGMPQQSVTAMKLLGVGLVMGGFVCFSYQSGASV